ncbi:MAG: helix-turn-helix domain-containing protein [Eubacteriales bacterium]|nr:helix-turn-helix domain-containing protein [Eubacteriales bacterium]
MNKIEFGLKLRKLREQKNLTQVEFAEMIDISDKALSRIEVGRTLPHLNTLMSMTEALNVSLEFLIPNKDKTAKEIYSTEINTRLAKMSEFDIKHILGYIDFYLTQKEEQKLSLQQNKDE